MFNQKVEDLELESENLTRYKEQIDLEKSELEKQIEIIEAVKSKMVEVVPEVAETFDAILNGTMSINDLSSKQKNQLRNIDLVHGSNLKAGQTDSDEYDEDNDAVKLGDENRTTNKKLKHRQGTEEEHKSRHEEISNQNMPTIEQVAQMAEEFEKLEIENQQLVAKLRELIDEDGNPIPPEEFIAEFQEQNSQLEEQKIIVEKMHGELEDLGQKLEALLQENEEKDSLIQERNQHIGELEVRYNEMLEKMDQFQALEEVQDLITKYQELQAMYEDQVQKNQELVEAIQTIEQGEIGEEQKEQILEEFEKLNRKNETLREALEAKEGDGVSKLVAIYENQLDTLVQENQALVAALKDMGIEDEGKIAEVLEKYKTYPQDLNQDDHETKTADYSNNLNSLKDADSTNELAELLKAASQELQQLKRKYELLRQSEIENEEQVRQLKMENAELREIAKNSGSYEVSKKSRVEGSEKDHETLLKENDQLMEILKTAADEIRLLRSKYGEAVSELNTHAKGNHQVADLIQDDLNDAKSKIEDFQSFNKKLWESLEDIKSEKSKLLAKIKKLEAWCKEKGLGLPPITERDSNLKGNSGTSNIDLQEASSYHAKRGNSAEKDQLEDEELTVEKLVELLLFTVQLMEGIRQTAVNDADTQGERLAAIVEMIDNFEIMGESQQGKFDLNFISQRLIEQKIKTQESDDQVERSKDSKQSPIHKNQTNNNQKSQNGKVLRTEASGSEIQVRISTLPLNKQKSRADFDDDAQYFKQKLNEACQLLEEKDSYVNYKILLLTKRSTTSKRNLRRCSRSMKIQSFQETTRISRV